MSKLKALGSRIIFEFIDTVNAGRFGKVTKSGIIVRSEDNQDQTRARWVKILSTGSQVTSVKEGDIVLLEPLKWTIGLPMGNGKKVWQSDEEFIMAVATDPEMI